MPSAWCNVRPIQVDGEFLTSQHISGGFRLSQGDDFGWPSILKILTYVPRPIDGMTRRDFKFRLSDDFQELRWEAFDVEVGNG